MLRGSVAREDVLAFFADRLEMEIVALPEHVTVEDVEDVSSETARAETPPFVEVESA